MLNVVAQHALASSSTLILAAANARAAGLAAQAYRAHARQQSQHAAAPLQHRAAVLDIAGLGLEVSPVAPSLTMMRTRQQATTATAAAPTSSSSADLTSEVLAFITSSGDQPLRCNIYRRSRLQI